jgi:hypothetical protein
MVFAEDEGRGQVGQSSHRWARYAEISGSMREYAEI